MTKAVEIYVLLVIIMQMQHVIFSMQSLLHGAICFVHSSYMVPDKVHVWAPIPPACTLHFVSVTMCILIWA